MHAAVSTKCWTEGNKHLVYERWWAPPSSSSVFHQILICAWCPDWYQYDTTVICRNGFSTNNLSRSLNFVIFLILRKLLSILPNQRSDSNTTDNAGLYLKVSIIIDDEDEIINMTQAWDKEKKSESPTGIKPTTSQTPGGRSIHWVTRTHGEWGD